MLNSRLCSQAETAHTVNTQVTDDGSRAAAAAASARPPPTAELSLKLKTQLRLSVQTMLHFEIRNEYFLMIHAF